MLDALELSRQPFRRNRSRLTEEQEHVASLGLERLMGDLSISINDMNGGTVQRQLSDLCDRLEAAEAFGDGLLEEFWHSSSARTSRC